MAWRPPEEGARGGTYISDFKRQEVKIILEKAISSPAEVELTELNEATRWVEDGGTVRRLHWGADRDSYSSQIRCSSSS